MTSILISDKGAVIWCLKRNDLALVSFWMRGFIFSVNGWNIVNQQLLVELLGISVLCAFYLSSSVLNTSTAMNYCRICPFCNGNFLFSELSTTADSVNVHFQWVLNIAPLFVSWRHNDNIKELCLLAFVYKLWLFFQVLSPHDWKASPLTPPP